MSVDSERTERPRDDWRNVLLMAALAAAYFVAGKASFSLAVSHNIVTLVVFAAEGLSLAAVIVLGPRIWPGVFIGQLALAVSNGLAWPLSLAISAINSVEAVAGGWLFHHYGLHRGLGRVRDVVRLLALIALLQTFSATLGNAVLVVGGVILPADLMRSWFSWWFGNALGQVLVTPMLLSLSTLGPWRAQVKEAVVGVGTLAPLAAVLLWAVPHTGVALTFAVFTPLLVVLAVHRGMAAVSAAICTIAALTLARTHDLGGPFVVGDQVLMVDLNIFLLGIALVGQLIAATFQERQAADELHLELLKRLQRIATEVPGVIFELHLSAVGGMSMPYVNQDLSRVYQVAPDDAMADVMCLETRHHPEDRQKIRRSLGASARDMTQWNLEYRIVLQDGAIRWVSGNATPHLSPDGTVVWYGFFTDVTERKEIERVKDTFVATVSHELRTPLTSIVGALGLCTQGALGSLSEPMGRMLAVAHRNSLRLGHLIQDLLDIEKLAAGKVVFDLRPQPLMPLLEHAVDANAAFAAGFNVRYEIGERVEDAQVIVDGDRLLQVMANLLSNAARFSPPGGVVRVDASREGDDVRVEVTDHGAGIPASFQPRVFQKFSQADEGDNRKPGGTGLGLAITKELIERMDGRIDFDSPKGGPTRFYFVLPLASPESAAGGLLADPRSGSAVVVTPGI